MAAKGIEMLLSMSTLVVVLWGVTVGQTESSCNNAIMSLYPCLDYITGNASAPSSGCCSQLASVVRSQPHCLCEIINGGGSSIGLNINRTRALALPGACGVQTPPVSSCNAPSGTPNSPSGNGSNTNSGDSASSGGGSSQLHANSIKLPSALLVSFLFVSSSTLTLTTTPAMWLHIF